MFILNLVALLATVLFGSCQSSELVIDIVDVNTSGKVQFSCNVSSSTNLTRWTFLSGFNGTSLLSYQNGLCTVSPSDSFLSKSSIYSYTCNSTVYQVTIYSKMRQFDNHILACRDAIEPDASGSTWMIKSVKVGDTCNCTPTIIVDIKELTEGDSVTFICKVPSDVSYVYWNKTGSTTAAMSSQNGECITQGVTFLDDTSKYFYTCNRTVYQVTRLNVNRSEHNDLYMCTPPTLEVGTGSNWMIKVKAPVTSVKLTPPYFPINVKETTALEVTCTTSTARPAASVYWYIYGNNYGKTQITDNITTATDFNDLSVTTSTLLFVPTRYHNDTNIYCTANNTINTSPVKSKDILLNVLYKAEEPYVAQGNEYRVIEDTPGKLSCSVKGGNPTPTLSWSCNNFAPTNQSTIKSNGNTTTTLSWIVSSTNEGTCKCTSQQTGFTDQTVAVSLVILLPPSKPLFRVNGSIINGDVSFIEGTTGIIECTSDSKPSPDRFTWTGPSIVDSLYNSTLTLNNIEKKETGKYKCVVQNTMNITSIDSVTGISSNTVNIVVLHSPYLAPINNMSIQKGEEINLMCPYTAGMPTETSIIWTRNIDDKQWNGEELYILSVEKSDAANYSCNVSNVMKPSGESISYIGQDTQSFYLDVLYEVSVKYFTIEGIASRTVTKMKVI